MFRFNSQELTEPQPPTYSSLTHKQQHKIKTYKIQGNKNIPNKKQSKNKQKQKQNEQTKKHSKT